MQRDIDRELARLDAKRTANPPRKMEVLIDLNSEAATSATLRVSYAVRGAHWAPIYDARLDTGAGDRKPSLELVRRAEIVQSTGEDWRDVQLAVSTVRTAKGGSAPELRSLIVRYPTPPRGYEGASYGAPAAPPPSAARPAPAARAHAAKGKTSIHNGHDTPLRIVIEDQIPVSEIDDVKVELLPTTTAPTERDVRNRRGVLAWNFEATPGEVKEIRVAWRVRWPADKTIVFAPGQ